MDAQNQSVRVVLNIVVFSFLIDCLSRGFFKCGGGNTLEIMPEKSEFFSNIGNRTL